MRLAAPKGHADVVKVLLAANAAVDAKSDIGRGPRGAEGGEVLLERERSWGALAEVVGPYSEGLTRVETTHAIIIGIWMSRVVFQFCTLHLCSLDIQNEDGPGWSLTIDVEQHFHAQPIPTVFHMVVMD